MNTVIRILSRIPIPLVVLVIAVLIGGAAVRHLRSRLKNSVTGSLLQELIAAYRRGEFEDEYQIAEKPRSLSGMTSLCLPKIEKDFPEFSWQEWRLLIEKRVRELAGEKGESPAVYRTVIADYRKNSGNVFIITDTSASYIPKQTRQPPLKTQSVFETELLYVQTEEGAEGRVHGLNCPNCGAPIEGLGVRICRYCGTTLDPVSRRVWTIHAVKEK